jgi:hypothetical protein
MKYRVFWDPYAEGQLKQIIQDSAIHPQIVAAVRSINTQRTLDPCDLGESRFDEIRIAFVSPLALLFEVLQDVKTVIVCEVWRVE